MPDNFFALAGDAHFDYDIPFDQLDFQRKLGHTRTHPGKNGVGEANVRAHIGQPCIMGRFVQGKDQDGIVTS